MLRRVMGRSVLLFWLAAVFVCALAACEQDSGEACQVDRDCGDGLVCNRGVSAERGTCIDPDRIDGGLGGTGGTGGASGTGGGGGTGAPDAGPSTDDAGTSDADGG
jgi:hypothetical protein